MKPYGIGFADLLRAGEVLDLTDESERRSVAGMLGLSYSPRMERPEQQEEEPSNKSELTPPEQPPQPEPKQEKAPEEQDLPMSALVPVGNAVQGRPDIDLNQVAPVKRDETETRIATSHQPFYDPDLIRALLTDALKTVRLSNEPDMEAIIETITDGHPITHIPRLKRRTFHPEAAIVWDRSEHLAPYQNDFAHLWEEALGLLGSEARPHYVMGAARMKAPKDISFPPPLGVPILALTDFGLIDPFWEPPSRRNWIRFSYEHAGHPRRVFLPCSSRIPEDWGWKVVGPGRKKTARSRLDPELEKLTKLHRFQHLASGDADALRLLLYLSPAVSAEPALIRAMRLALLPNSDPGIEGDLWSGPHIEERNPLRCFFDPSLLAELRTHLNRTPALWKEAREIIEAFREMQKAPQLIRLEETLIDLAYRAEYEPEQDQLIENELLSLLKGILREKREGLAYWVLQHLEDLPPRINNRETAQLLLAAAELHFADESVSWASGTSDDGVIEAKLAGDGRWLPVLGVEHGGRPGNQPDMAGRGTTDRGSGYARPFAGGTLVRRRGRLPQVGVEGGTGNRDPRPGLPPAYTVRSMLPIR